MRCQRPNQPLQLTAARTAFTFFMTKPSHSYLTARFRQPSLILFSLIWLSICQRVKEVWCECLHRSGIVGAGLRRRISRGELGSRRLVMLIFAGYPVLRPDLSGILLIHRSLCPTV